MNPCDAAAKGYRDTACRLPCCANPLDLLADAVAQDIADQLRAHPDWDGISVPYYERTRNPQVPLNDLTSVVVTQSHVAAWGVG